MFAKFFKLSHLKNESKQRQIYSNLYNKHGKSHLSLHWSNKKNQQRRFEILAEIADLQGATVLDIGCGFGDFFSFLNEKGIHCHYTGYDICGDFIVQAQKNHPKANFEERNILAKPPHDKFDYVVMSGIFAFGDSSFFRDMLRTTFEIAQKGIAFNIHRTMHPNFFRISDKEVNEFCQSLSPKRILFKEGYLQDDFTCFIYKN